MKTIYTIDFSKCYYCDLNTRHYKDYYDFLNIDTYWFVNESSISFVNKGLAQFRIYLYPYQDIYKTFDDRDCEQWASFEDIEKIIKKFEYYKNFSELLDE